MRQVLPEPVADVDPAALYAADRREPAGDRPWVAVNMIASVDGATAVDGRSGGLGGPGDRAVFRAVRAVADVILVGAGTARAERYRLPALDAGLIDARRRRGQAELPRLAIVSRRLDLAGIPAVNDRDHPPPIIVTTEDAAGDATAQVVPQAGAGANLAGSVELLRAGTGTVDLTAAVGALRQRYGAGVVVAEGGPSLNAALAGAGLIDELCLSVAPVLAGGSSRRVVHGAPPTATPLVLARVLEDDGFLFLRLVRAGERPPAPPPTT